MPLRDHFHQPVSTRSSWEGFHGGWPMAIVQRLSPLLPDNFTAEPPSTSDHTLRSTLAAT